MREYGEPDRRYVRWEHDDDPRSVDLRERKVAILRFCRADGLDPRVSPEPEGTHLQRVVGSASTRRAGRRRAASTAPPSWTTGRSPP